MRHINQDTRITIHIGPIVVHTNYDTLCGMYAHYNSYNGSAYQVAYRTVEHDPEVLFRWLREVSYINLMGYVYSGIPDLSRAEIVIGE